MQTKISSSCLAPCHTANVSPGQGAGQKWPCYAANPGCHAPTRMWGVVEHLRSRCSTSPAHKPAHPADPTPQHGCTGADACKRPTSCSPMHWQNFASDHLFTLREVRCELQSSHQSSLHQLIGQRLTQKLCSCAEHGLRRPTADAQPWMLHHLPLLQSACLVLHTQVVWVTGALAVCRGSTVRQASGNSMETGHEPI